MIEKAQAYVREALQTCEQQLPPCATYRAIVSYEESDFVLQQMDGTTGLTGSGERLSVYFDGRNGAWRSSIAATVYHEYNHLVWYQLHDTHFAETTLADALVLEGCAQVFEEMLSGQTPAYAQALSREHARSVWHRLHPQLDQPAAAWVPHAIIGGNEEFPLWGGYTVAYELLKPIITSHGGIEHELMGRPSNELLAEAAETLS